MTEELETVSENHGILEEEIESAINSIETEGVDFKEEAAYFEIDLPSRPDLLLTVTVVDKKVADIFVESESMYGGFH